MTTADLRVARVRSGLRWHALDSDLVAGEVSARLRPDGRCFVFFDVWRADAYPLLADAVGRELGCDLYVSLDDGEYDAFDACTAAGFVVRRRESYYRIPTDQAVAALSDAALPDGLEALSAADADVDRLRRLDDALRQDVPGTDGWRWDESGFLDETFSPPFFDPATYLVAVNRASGEYAGLVRVWRTRGGPRLGLIAVLPAYRRRGAATALLARVFTVLSERGQASVTAEADDANAASIALLTRLGARRYGGSVEMIRRHEADASR